MTRKPKSEWLEFGDVLSCVGDLFSDESGLMVLALILVVWGALWAVSRLWESIVG